MHVYAPEPDSPAMQVAAAQTVAAYEDAEALAAFARAVDVVTFEFENVPAAALDALERLVPCRPGVAALRIGQDRVLEKRFLESAGLAVAPWREVQSEAEAEAALAALGAPCLLKTTRLGYDGRGQAVVRTPDEARAAFERLAPKPLIAEGFIRFVAEISAIAARGAHGALALYDPAENRHENHILAESRVPTRQPAAICRSAQDGAAAVAESLGLVGVVAVEYFVTEDGRLLANEIAPRPHNSGHWTIEACPASQFEQQVRAAAGLPLGDSRRRFDAEMVNLIGPEGRAAWGALAADPAVALHWYGKPEARPGRKLGHATRLWPRGGP
jgi:5-(carboxyamino)imidazole ribonucleotide synthase